MNIFSIICESTKRRGFFDVANLDRNELACASDEALWHDLRDLVAQLGNAAGSLFDGRDTHAGVAFSNVDRHAQVISGIAGFTVLRSDEPDKAIARRQLLKLLEEIAELYADPSNVTEAADVVITAVNFAIETTGCTGDDLHAAVVAKLAADDARGRMHAGQLPLVEVSA